MNANINKQQALQGRFTTMQTAVGAAEVHMAGDAVSPQQRAAAAWQLGRARQVTEGYAALFGNFSERELITVERNLDEAERCLATAEQVLGL